MADRVVLVRLQADISSLRTNFNAAAKQSDDLSSRFAQFATKNEQHFTRVGQASLAMGAAAAAGMAISVRAAVQWESAWAGVNKTVDGSAKQMAALEGELRNMAKTLPISHTELAGIAEAAGQLGVKRESIAGFTKTIVDLGNSTSLSFEEAGTGLARFSNIMGTSLDDSDRLGSVLVDLGNNAATTESEILALGTRLAAAGKIAGLSESDVFAFASTLTSVGVEAEAGGTALSKVFTSIRDAVLTGGDNLETFARVAGVTTDQFTQSFGQDAAGAVSSFVGGLGRINASGKSTTEIFESLELTDQRLMRALLSTAGAGELLNEQLVLGNDAWEANTALVEEANKRYETTESKMRVAKNSLNDLAIGIGSTLLPALSGAADKVAALAEFFGRMPAPLQGLVAILGTLTAVVGLTGGAALIAAPRIVAMKASLDILGVSAATTGRAMTGLSMAMKGGAIAGAALGVAFALDQLVTALAPAGPPLNALTDSMADFGQQGRLTSELLSVVGDDFTDVGKKIKDASQNKWLTWDSVGEITTFREELDALDGALAALVQRGSGDLAAEIFGGIARDAEANGVSVETLNERFGDYGEAVAGVSTESKLAGEGIAGMGDAAADATGPVQELTEAQKALESALSSFVDPSAIYSDMVREAAEDVATAQTESVDKQIKAVQRDYEARIDAARKIKGASADTIAALEDQRDATVSTLEEGKGSWEDYADQVEISLGDVAAQLEAEIAAREDWRANLVQIAQRYGTETAQIVAEMGVENAGLAAKMADDVGGEGQRMAEALVENARAGGEGAARELDQQMKVMAAVGKAGGKLTAEALAAELEVGLAEAAAIAASYSVELYNGISPMLEALGSKGLDVQSYARREAAGANRPVQRAIGGPVWGAGTATSDSIPALLSNGEYVIRASSVSKYGQGMLDELNEGRFATGGAVRRRLQAFATGGFASEADVPRPPSTAPFGHPISTAADGTMAYAYGEAVDWVKANAAPALGEGIGWQAMMAALRTRFPGLPLNSGYRPGSITATGNASYHGKGRAVDVPPRMDVNKWIAEHYGSQTKELIFSAAGATQLRNGRPHYYSGVTRAMHFDHNHWAMAKGGILNPHVRDRGGPLLPGLTFNGTGAAEMVLPMAAGGIVNPLTRNATLSGDAGRIAARGGSAEDVRALVTAWEAYNDAVKQAAARQELVTGAAAAKRAFDMAKGMKDRTAALADLNEANGRLRDFDAAARVDAEKAAVDRLVDSLEAQAKAEVDAADVRERRWTRRAERTDNRFELGMLSATKYVAVLDQRMAAERKFSDEWTSLYRQREGVLDDVAAAEAKAVDDARETADRAVADLSRMLDEEARVRASAERSSADFYAGQLARQERYVADSAAALNGLLDQEVAVRGRLSASASAHLDAVTAVQARQVTAEAEFYARSASLSEDYQQGREQAEDAFAGRSAQAARSYAASQAQILARQSQTLAARRDELFAWADMSTAVESRWGNSAAQLIGNVRAQAGQFADWMAELATARGRGLSEEVIGALGLDDGPQSLAQLRQLNGATVAEIADLNAEVARRTALAGQQVRSEQSRGFASVATEMAAAQEAYNAEMAELSAAHGLSQADALAAYTTAAAALQSAYTADQQALAAQLGGMQTAFVEEQHALTVELGQIGVDQGRSHTDALAAALTGGLPGVQAAADQLAHALGGGLTDEMRLAHVEFLAEQEALTVELASVGTEQGRSYADALAAGIGSGVPAIRAAADAAAAAMAAAGSSRSGLVQGPQPPGGWTRQQQAVIDMGGIIRTGDQLRQLHLGSYDSGGWLQPGLTLAYNGTGAPERVLTQQQMPSQPGPISVTVLLGDREIRDIVGVEVNGVLTQHRTVAAVSGARG